MAGCRSQRWPQSYLPPHMLFCNVSLLPLQQGECIFYSLVSGGLHDSSDQEITIDVALPFLGTTFTLPLGTFTLGMLSLRTQCWAVRSPSHMEGPPGSASVTRSWAPSWRPAPTTCQPVSVHLGYLAQSRALMTVAPANIWLQLCGGAHWVMPGWARSTHKPHKITNKWL